MRIFILLLAVSSAFPSATSAQSHDDPRISGDELIAQYFREETKKLTDRTFEGIATLDDWISRRAEYRRQLLEMLGLDPMPPKTPLVPEMTGSLQRAGVVVERLQFQSMPGLYVTANLYRPVDQSGPLPAILYVCGHGGEWEDGVSLGNKTHYQHHGVWFAQNGYVCLIIDTVQLGEFEGIHHGTYRENMWWWNNRGYSSAAVEAYNCVRSIDYLQSRKEVDSNRIGVTGRSGGGAYSWWIAAIDDRIKTAVPVAGITSLQNHVVDGCVEGHCDCMYMVNTYRWDFPMVAAMVAPRPLLIANSDKDSIFPLDGVVDVHAKVCKIYALYDATENLGLQISEGPHEDTQELRVAAFRWMNRFLREDTTQIDSATETLFDKRELRVFDKLPNDERVTTIHEEFVPKVAVGAININSRSEVKSLMINLRERCFGGWPVDVEPLEVSVIPAKSPSEDAYVIEFTSQSPYRLTMFAFLRPREKHAPLRVTVVDEAYWQEWASALAATFPERVAGIEPDAKRAEELARGTRQYNTIYLLPRGVGPTSWGNDDRERTHIRRRFMLLGQTMAGMQIYDVLRGLEAARSIPDLQPRSTHVTASGEAAFWTVYASLFDNDIDRLSLNDLPSSNRRAPDLLNISRFVEFPDVVKLAESRVQN